MDADLSLAATDFALFGLPERFGLDLPALDAKWKALQGAAHPDRFATETGAAQRVAMQWAIRINEAYRRLKNPLARAAYLCGLHGADVDAERNTAMPADFLMQQMAWRERLEDASAIGIFGQYVYVNDRTDTVIAKLSDYGIEQDEELTFLAMRSIAESFA